MTEVVRPPDGPGQDGFATSKDDHVIDGGKGRVFPCEKCGADLVYSIGHSALECPYCNSLKQLQIPKDQPILENDYEATLIRLSNLRVNGHDDLAHASDMNEVHCDSCGATVVFHGTLTSTCCPYCASTLERENVHRAPDRIPVDAILPFRLTSELAAQQFSQWIRSRWFAPSSFQKHGADERNVIACYVPYFTYDAMTFTRYDGTRGDYFYVQIQRGNQLVSQRQVRWTSAGGDFQRFFDDIAIAAMRSKRTDLLDGIQPWPTKDLVPFVPEFLAGLMARTYDVSLDDGFRDARRRIEATLNQDVVHRIGGDVQRVNTVKSAFSALTYKHLLFPVWLVVYQYQGRSYQIAINGATGAVAGDRPYSPIKIFLTVVFALGFIFFLLALTKGNQHGSSSFGPDIRFDIQFGP